MAFPNPDLSPLDPTLTLCVRSGTQADILIPHQMNEKPGSLTDQTLRSEELVHSDKMKIEDERRAAPRRYERVS